MNTKTPILKKFSVSYEQRTSLLHEPLPYNIKLNAELHRIFFNDLFVQIYDRTHNQIKQNLFNEYPKADI
jgi:hypothetical protein